MKKVWSKYSNNYYIYTYFYETKKVLLKEKTYGTKESECFQSYFGDITAEFNTLKEFKAALYNFSQHYNQYFNEKLSLEHKKTLYTQDYYNIYRSGNIYKPKKGWEIFLQNKGINKQFEFKYGVIDYYYDNPTILFNKEGQEKFYKNFKKIDNKLNDIYYLPSYENNAIKNKSCKKIDNETKKNSFLINDLKNINLMEDIQYQYLTTTRPTIKTCIKDFEFYLNYFEIKNALKENNLI